MHVISYEASCYKFPLNFAVKCLVDVADARCKSRRENGCEMAQMRCPPLSGATYTSLFTSTFVPFPHHNSPFSLSSSSPPVAVLTLTPHSPGCASPHRVSSSSARAVPPPSPSRLRAAAIRLPTTKPAPTPGLGRAKPGSPPRLPMAE